MESTSNWPPNITLGHAPHIGIPLQVQATVRHTNLPQPPCCHQDDEHWCAVLPLELATKTTNNTSHAHRRCPPRDPYELNPEFLLILPQSYCPISTCVSSFDKRDISGVRVGRALFFGNIWIRQNHHAGAIFRPRTKYRTKERRKHSDWVQGEKLGETDTYTNVV